MTPVCKRIKRGFGRLYEGRNVVADRCNERELGGAVKNSELEERVIDALS